ncbi:MAG: phage major capsid domain-containing protein [Candidatus Fonsibacter sp.]
MKSLYALNPLGARHIAQNTDTTIYVAFEVTEPLVLSPFIFGSGYGKQGFYGIQSINFQMVMTGNANPAWRSARQITNVKKDSYGSVLRGHATHLPTHNPARFRYVGPPKRCAVL